MAGWVIVRGTDVIDAEGQVAAVPKRVSWLAITSAILLLAGYGCITYVLRGGGIPFQQLAVVICIAAALLALVSVIEISRRRLVGLWLAISVLLLAFVGMFFGEAEIEMTRVPAEEATAVGSLRTLNRALIAYAQAHQSEGYPSSLLQLSCQRESWCVDSALARGTNQGFRYSYVPGATQSDGIRDRYQILAAPTHDAGYRRHFFIDDSGSIRYGYGKADQGSPALN